MCGNCTCKPRSSSILKMGEKELTGSHLVGRLNTSYDNLVKVFDNPSLDRQDGKTDAFWCGKLLGIPFTIYNWKNGSNYGYNIKVEDMKEWNIGGFSNETETLIKQYLKWKLSEIN